MSGLNLARQKECKMATDLTNAHPSYAKMIKLWKLMRDCYEGEAKIKEEGQIYLPPTEGMLLDGMAKGQIGHARYMAYVMRSVFPDLVKEAVEKTIGLLHQKEPTIELPEKLEPLRDKATTSGESLNALLRRINESQLVTGRLGLLGDLPEEVEITEDGIPRIALYDGEDVLNWDDNTESNGMNSLNLVVINETAPQRKGFEWEIKEKYRVLVLGDVDENEAEGTAVYHQGVFDENSFDESALFTPTYRGRILKRIPFVFINTKDIISEVDKPPLEGLARAVLNIYRGEADYRQNIHMQGQETLVIVGGGMGGAGIENDNATRIGTGSKIEVELGGDAKFIGISSSGLSEQREALKSDYSSASLKAGELITTTASQQESGEALRTRLTAQTASLNQIAYAGAAGLENILKIIAEWVDADPDEVKVIPNIEFADFALAGQDLMQIMTAIGMGAPLSVRSIHALCVERGLTNLSFEDELKYIGEERTQEYFANVLGTKTANSNADTEVPDDVKDDIAEDELT